MKPVGKIILVILIVSVTSCGSFKKGYKKYQEGKYQEAIEEFQKVERTKPNDVLNNFYLAQSYRKSNRLDEAVEHYAKVQGKRIPKIHSEDHPDDAKFYYALALEESGKFDEAQKQYELYARAGRNGEYVRRAKKEIQNLKQREELLKTKTFYEVKNCTGLNTPGAEFSPVAYQSSLLFSSSRKQSVYYGNGQNHTGIYQFTFENKDDCQGNAEIFHPTLHLEEVNEATPAISKDGKTMIFARGNTGKRKGIKSVKLYISRFENGVWTEPEILQGVSSNDEETYYGKPTPKSQPKAYTWDSSPAFSPDGETLYFASDRPYDDRNTRSFGRIDLYSAKLQRDGTWGEVRNLGGSINTEGDEMFPFVDNSGRLFFSSDGHPSLGGLDIFMAERKDGKISVENVGSPLNSEADDLSIYFISDTTGYFASNRKEGKGDDDIYWFINKEPKTRTINYAVKFRTFGLEPDASEIILANTRIKLLDRDQKIVQELKTNSQGVSEVLPVLPTTEFEIVADVLEQKKPYLTTRQSFTMAGRLVPQKYLSKAVTDTVFIIDLKLQKIEVNKTSFEISLLYDYNKWAIRPDAAKVLDQVIQFLKDNPEVEIELGSHTDSRGTNADNELLAQRRAQSAVDYLVEKGGFDRSKITPKGYGEEYPKTIDRQLAENYELPEGELLTEGLINSQEKEVREALHQLNRRTEIKITGIVK